MAHFPPFELLDDILAIVLANGLHISEEQLVIELENRSIYKGISANFFDEVMNKLIDDKYIRKEDKNYVLTFDGIYFEDAGGYVELEKTLSHRRIWEKEIQEAGPKHAHRLNLLTAALILVAIGVLFWDAYKYYHPIH